MFRRHSGPVDRRLAALLATWALLFVAANLGTILAPTLIDDFPAALLTMGARNRVLLLTIAADIDWPAFFAIGFFRLLLPAFVIYTIGYHYGDVGRAWLARQNGGKIPSAVQRTERWFDRARSPVVVFFVGSNIVALLSGSRRLPIRRYAPLLVTGVIVRLVFFWFLGQALKTPLEWLLGWIQRLQWPLTAAAVVLVFLQMRKLAPAAEEVAEEVIDGPPYGDLDRPGDDSTPTVTDRP